MDFFKMLNEKAEIMESLNAKNEEPVDDCEIDTDGEECDSMGGE